MNICAPAILVAVVVAAGLAGCQSSAPGGRTVESIPHLDAEAARAAGFSTQEVSAASELYETKCAKCIWIKLHQRPGVFKSARSILSLQVK